MKQPIVQVPAFEEGEYIEQLIHMALSSVGVPPPEWIFFYRHLDYWKDRAEDIVYELNPHAVGFYLASKRWLGLMYPRPDIQHTALHEAGHARDHFLGLPMTEDSACSFARECQGKYWQFMYDHAPRIVSPEQLGRAEERLCACESSGYGTYCEA
jgi:hypothetical protein